jgi:2-succinyl-5-enolpyruvyl-6-hydroxy-3-cyclohexene-1-carboxylate synthase
MHAPNRNYLWTYTFVDELARCGLQAVVIAPGSRSTPLTMAFAQHPAIRVYSHIDERGAAFMALGLALASDAPVAVVCSSGTAAANFFPAIVEAHYAHVPLLVLTADRPHELRDSGANQTVDQVKLYGDHVLWSVDVALPEANPPDVAIRNLRTLADRAYALADGLPKGAVHLNFPFRKPLEPIAVEGEGWEVEWWGEPDGKFVNLLSTAPPSTINLPVPNTTPFTWITRGFVVDPAGAVEIVAANIRASKRGLIICGPRSPSGDFPGAVEALAMTTGYVLLADSLSGIRYAKHWQMGFGGYEWFIRNAHEWGDPDLVIHFGAMPISQALNDYLNKIEPRDRIVVTDDGTWTDSNHLPSVNLLVDPTTLCKTLAQRTDLRELGDQVWWDRFADAESLLTTDDWLLSQAADGEFSDVEAVMQTAKAIPTGSPIFIANSLAVRHLDQFAIWGGGDHRVYCNRGASGIDGTISSALGIAAGQPYEFPVANTIEYMEYFERVRNWYNSDDKKRKPTVLIIGDLAFYHDMNALLAAKRNGIKNLVIVLLNNNGGAIFSRLPINQPQFEPYFTELFTTPHGMTFEHTAAQFGWAYARTDEREPFREAFAAALASGEPTIIEVVTDAQEDARRRKEIMDKVAEALKNLNHEE